jgi:DNA-binding transcriptional ArsR family regulator
MPVDPARLNAVGDLVLNDPRELRALADPKQLALFDLLRREGSMTTTELAQGADLDQGAVEEGLRELESLGLLERAVGPNGETRWASAVKGIHFEIPDDPEGQVAARRLSSAMIANYAELPTAWVRDQEPRLDLEWARAAGLFNARVRLTAAELRDIQEQLERLLAPLTTRADADVPPGASPVRILGFFLPDA